MSENITPKAISIFEKYDLFDVDESIQIPEIPEDGLVLIVGSSGSGKSTIMRSLGTTDPEFMAPRLIDDFTSHEAGERLLLSCGLRSIPTWLRPYITLSNGEKHRAYCAKTLDNGSDCIDEFSSVVDRNTAKSLSCSIEKHFRNNTMKRLVIASCHRDIIPWLRPDHIYDTDLKSWTQRGSLRQSRPALQMVIHPCGFQDWVRFQNHHYLDRKVSRSCHFYIGLINGQPVAFSAVIHACNRDIHSYWRGSRLVVLPEWQGMGIGVRMSEEVASIYTERGKRFFSKTAHPSLGEYRNLHPEKWRATSTNMKSRPSYLKDGKARKSKGFGKSDQAKIRDAKRVCYSHEFIGVEA